MRCLLASLVLLSRARARVPCVPLRPWWVVCRPPPLRFVYTSFGGLLMQLSGEPKVLPAQSFAVDKRVYLFVRKVAAA